MAAMAVGNTLTSLSNLVCIADHSGNKTTTTATASAETRRTTAVAAAETPRITTTMRKMNEDDKDPDRYHYSQ